MTSILPETDIIPSPRELDHLSRPAVRPAPRPAPLRRHRQPVAPKETAGQKAYRYLCLIGDKSIGLFFFMFDLVSDMSKKIARAARENMFGASHRRAVASMRLPINEGMRRFMITGAPGVGKSCTSVTVAVRLALARDPSTVVFTSVDPQNKGGDARAGVAADDRLIQGLGPAPTNTQDVFRVFPRHMYERMLIWRDRLGIMSFKEDMTGELVWWANFHAEQFASMIVMDGGNDSTVPAFKEALKLSDVAVIAADLDPVRLDALPKFLDSVGPKPKILVVTKYSWHQYFKLRQMKSDPRFAGYPILTLPQTHSWILHKKAAVRTNWINRRYMRSIDRLAGLMVELATQIDKPTELSQGQPCMNLSALPYPDTTAAPAVAH